MRIGSYLPLGNQEEEVKYQELFHPVSPLDLTERPATNATWFWDITRTIESLLEKEQWTQEDVFSVWIEIEGCQYLYGKSNDSVKSIQEHIMYTFHNLLQELIDFTKQWDTLKTAEGFQKAREKQQRNSGYFLDSEKQTRFRAAYWTGTMPETCFYELATQYCEIYGKSLSSERDRIAKRLSKLWIQYSSYPISSMLLPILFTKALTDGSGGDTAYARLKTTKERSGKSLDRDLKLFTGVKGILESYLTPMKPVHDGQVFISEATISQFEPELPIFEWRGIFEAFCKYQKCSGGDQIAAIRDIFVSQGMLHQAKTGSVKLIPAGDKETTTSLLINLKALLSLCNINTYLELKSGVTPSSQINNALNKLAAGELLPLPEGTERYQEDSWELYCHVFSKYIHFADLSNLAFVKYYGIKSKSNDIICPGAPYTIMDSFDYEATAYIKQLHQRFIDNQVILDLRKTEMPNASFLPFATQLISQITTRFNKAEYEMFVCHSDNLSVKGFYEFFTHFLERHSITKSPVSSEAEAYVVSEAYHCFLILSQAHLRNQVFDFCKRLLEYIVGERIQP